MPGPVQCEWTSDESIASVMGRIRAHTEPVDGGFTLMHRLSGAGVVVRTLQAPETAHPFFGKIFDDRFHIAVVPSSKDITPYHPIVRATVTPSPSGGTHINAELAHHPNARSFAFLYLFGAFALAVGTLVAQPHDPAMWIGGLGLAGLFAVFPSLQARVRFQQSVERTKLAVSHHLQLTIQA